MGVPDTRHLTPVLVGPTGVGKTAVAAALAAFAPITVISADARQVYRGLDIGTAKPEPAIRARVPHYGLDLVEPGERYSAGRFARDAADWLAQVRAAGRLPVVVGGTGFYIRALTDGLFREPALDPGRREALRGWTEGVAPPDLVRWASRLDPRFAGGGRQRAARAVEIALLTGRSLSWWQREARQAGGGVIQPWYIHLTLPRETLERRIRERVARMLAAGWVDEVRQALARGVAGDAPGLDALGYREIVASLEGRLAAAALPDAIAVATRRYAKRQETWFRNQLRGDEGRGTGEGSVWTLDAAEAPERLATRIIERWHIVTRPSSPVPRPME